MANTVTTVKWLSTYDVGSPSSMKLIGNALAFGSGSDSQSSRSSKSKSKGWSNGSTLQTPSSSSSSQGYNNDGKPRLSYFICHRPHKFLEYPRKKALNTMKLQEEAQGGKKGNKGDFEEEDQRRPRINAI